MDCSESSWGLGAGRLCSYPSSAVLAPNSWCVLGKWLQISQHFPLNSLGWWWILDLWGWVWFFFWKRPKVIWSCVLWLKEMSNLKNVVCFVVGIFFVVVFRLKTRWHSRIEAVFSQGSSRSIASDGGTLKWGAWVQWWPLWQKGRERELMLYWAATMCQVLYIPYLNCLK